MKGRAPLTITSARHPFELGCFLCAVSVGIWGLLVPDGISTAISNAFYPWAVQGYYAFMGLWGLAAAACVVLIREQDLRLRVERCCCYGVGWGALCYATAAIFTTGLSAGTAAMPWAWVSIVCTWRILQIPGERRRLRAALANPHLADPPLLGCPAAGDADGTGGR